jgi:hypothetical protein
MLLPLKISRHVWVYAIRPGGDAAGQFVACGETGLVQFFTVIASESTAFFPVTPSSPASTPL